MCTFMGEPMVAFSCDDISPKTKVAKLEELLRTINRFDMNITFFVIPKGQAKWNSCSSLVEVLKDAQSCGHEIGLHGLSHFVFEAGNPLNTFSIGCSSLRDKISKGLRILNEELEMHPTGFRAPYHHCSQSLFRVLEDLNFLYDSSKMALTSVLLSYFPPLRAISVSRKLGVVMSRMFHPLNLKLWEIPITQEYTWYNLKFEVNPFKVFLKNHISKIEAGSLVVNSHIGALSKWGLHILRELFQSIKEMGLSNLTLQEMAERSANVETAKAYLV